MKFLDRNILSTKSYANILIEMLLLNINETFGEKLRTAEECNVLFWTNPRNSTPQNSS